MIKIRFLLLIIASVIFSTDLIAESLPKNFLQMLHQDYLALKQQLPNASAKEIKVFLQHYANTPVAKQLYKLWLIQLAQQKRWKDYQDFYKADEDLSLRCYALLASFNVKTPKNFLAQVLPLWQVGTSQPAACNELFNVLIKRQLLTEPAIWQRFQLAMMEENISLAQQLAKLLTTKEKQHIAQVWLAVYKHPKNFSKIFSLARQWQQKILAQGIQRVALTDIRYAQQLWDKYAEQYPFSIDERDAIYRIFSLEYAFEGNVILSDRWSKKLPANKIDAALREWQIRAAMLKQDWLQVQKHIERLPEEERKMPQWRYWLARAFGERQQQQKAAIIYKSLRQEKNYYGFLASLQLKQAIMFVPTASAPIKTDILFAVVSKEDLAYLKKVYQQGSHTDARLLLKTLLASLNDAEKYALAVQLVEWDWHERAIAVMEETNYAKDYTDNIRIRFPLAYVDIVKRAALQFNLSPALIYAIIRQETTFQHDAKSTADAMGLMQILPKNARALAPKMQVTLKGPYDLLQPENNIKLGTAYLSYLDKYFKHHYTLTASAYNVGITNIIKRQKKQLRQMPMDLWIETMPWKETRNYIRNVMTYYVIYQYRLGQPLTLEPFMWVSKASPSPVRKI